MTVVKLEKRSPEERAEYLEMKLYEKMAEFAGYKARIRAVIVKHSRKSQRHYEDSWDIRPSDLLKELEL